VTTRSVPRAAASVLSTLLSSMLKWSCVVASRYVSLVPVTSAAAVQSPCELRMR
jgi:hypothetical protein